MSNQSCYTRVEEIPWFVSVADRSEAYLSTLPAEELSRWYLNLRETRNE